MTRRVFFFDFPPLEHYGSVKYVLYHVALPPCDLNSGGRVVLGSSVLLLFNFGRVCVHYCIFANQLHLFYSSSQEVKKSIDLRLIDCFVTWSTRLHTYLSLCLSSLSAACYHSTCSPLSYTTYCLLTTCGVLSWLLFNLYRYVFPPFLLSVFFFRVSRVASLLAVKSD